MNIFQMYEANDNRAGFWVFRDTWGYTCARIVSIACHTEGPLSPTLGRAPYYDKARDLVYAELYCFVPDLFGELHRIASPDFPAPDHPDLAVISCPGSFAYQRMPDLELVAK